jgi:YD repeat-containing protein
LLSSSTPLVGSEPLQARTVSYAHESKEHPGDVTAITDPNGKKTTLTYDSSGDLASVTDPEGDKTAYTYNEVGQRLTQVSPRGNVSGSKAAEYSTTFSYDAAGNRLTAVDPLGHERKWTYDADGNLETETDPNLHKTTFTYNAANEQTKVEKPNGNTTEVAYDADGNVSSQTDGLKHATTYTYDPLDHLASSTDPLGRQTTYAHDGLGRLISKKDTVGRTTTYSYDNANRLTKVSYSDGTTPTAEYGYDADGRRTSMKDGTGESTFKFDSLGRLTEAKDGHGDTTSYGYDLAGNETSITYPNGKKVTRTFDNAERLASVGDWLGNTTSFAYDANSNLLSSTFPKATSNTDEYAYNRADQMSGITMKKGTETLASLGYARDKDGQLESLTAKGLPGAESEAFGYDANNRLTKAGTESFEYDAASNLTKAPGTTNTYDSASELAAGSTASYSYDKEGERTRMAPSATEPPVFHLGFGGVGSGQGQLSSPAGVAIDKEGNAWVSDTGHNRIQEFNSKGEFIRQFGASGEGKGQFREPRGLAINQSSGNLYVADRNNNRIQEFNSKGEFIRAWGWGVINGTAELQVCTTTCRAGLSGEGNGQFNGLQGLAVDPEGHLWSVEAGKTSARVQKFSSEGAYLSQFGAKGTEAGKFESPQGIAVSPAGNVYVADTNNNRIQEFKPSGELIRGFGWGVANGEAKLQTCTTTCQVGIAGAGNGQLSHPDGLAFDPEGKLWVADTQNSRAQRFSAEGEYLSQFGSAGNNNGQLSEPQGIAVDSSGDVWVADTQNNRVQEWLWQITTYSYDQAGDLTSVQRREFGITPSISETYAYDGTGLRASQTVSGTKSYLTWDSTGSLPLLLNDGSTNYIYGPGACRSSRSHPKVPPITTTTSSVAPVCSRIPRVPPRVSSPTARTECSPLAAARKPRHSASPASTPTARVACSTCGRGPTIQRRVSSSAAIRLKRLRENLTDMPVAIPPMQWIRVASDGSARPYPLPGKCSKPSTRSSITKGRSKLGKAAVAIGTRSNTVLREPPLRRLMSPVLTRSLSVSLEPLARRPPPRSPIRCRAFRQEIAQTSLLFTAMQSYRGSGTVSRLRGNQFSGKATVGRWYGFLMGPRWAYAKPPAVVDLRLTSINLVKTQ